MATYSGVTVLIPAAGESRRFQQEGWNIPKPDLVIEYRNTQLTMLDHVFDRLPWTIVHEALVGVRRDMIGRSALFGAKFVTINQTRGQADTLLQLVEAGLRAGDLKDDTPVVIVNSDVLFRTTDLEHVAQRLLGSAPPDIVVGVQSSVNPAMSFVDHVPTPRHYAEKIVISTWAMAGVWGFRSARNLRNGLAAALNKDGEPYLSHAMNLVPAPQHEAIVLDNNHIVDWGTPSALEKSGAKIMNRKDYING